MTIGADGEISVSFVHGFHDNAPAPGFEKRPALWTIGPEGERTDEYLFPITPDDFDKLPYPILGEPPARDPARRPPAPERRPRFGFTGLQRVGDKLIAGSWNGFYRLDAMTKQVEAFITNRFTCYAHRFWADQDHIIFAMPFMDLIVIMDHDGNVQDRLAIEADLSVSRDLPNPNADWRFASKPWSGPTGLFHFNNVQKIGDEIVLVSRNLNAFVAVNPSTPAKTNPPRARLRTLNYKTTACIHDGDWVDGRFYLTSIDGKILVASPAPEHDRTLFRYDLQVDCTRLNGTIRNSTAAEHNWCRGIAVTPHHVYTTVDGRYGSDLSFAVLQLDRLGGMGALDTRRFEWTRVGDPRHVRYVTGFDILQPVEVSVAAMHAPH